NLCDTLPIIKLKNQLYDKKRLTDPLPVTYDELKKELQRKTKSGDSNLYNVNIKEDDDLCIIYYDNGFQLNPEKDNLAIEIEKGTRSCILEKSSLNIIATQFNKILYNNDAKEFLVNKEWNKVVVQTCYEGTMLMVFFYKNKWYVSTRRCLNAEDSTWVRNKSYKEMFNEAIEGKFKLEDLNKQYCYHFILVHYKNRNIVSYTNAFFPNTFDRNYKQVVHIMTTEICSLKEVDHTINDKVVKIDTLYFSCLDELYAKLEKISIDNKANKRITTEGFVMKVYDGEQGNSSFTVLKLQTDIYQTIMKIKPNNSNIYQSYLELYQNGKLNDFLPYFTKYSNEIIRRINMAVKTISKEILNIYHATRKKKNIELYESLSEQYKKALYEIHGIYINHRKKDFVNGKETTKDINECKSITVHDIYYYLKGLQSQQLRQIFYDRMIMIDNKINNEYLSKNCIYTLTQSRLMFNGNEIEKNHQE
ncbi:MAG: RNA ligase, partial [Edafosvirus sp.]